MIEMVDFMESKVNDNNINNNVVKNKPRLCEILGVEVYQKFYIKDYGPCYITEHGIATNSDNCFCDCGALCMEIEHPEYVKKITFSEEEKENVRVLLRLFGISKECAIKREKNGKLFLLIKGNVYKFNGRKYENTGENYMSIALEEGCFSSVKNGEEYTLDEII